MKAMILAAGEGTRLRPLTLSTPKVLLPVAGRPVIGHILGWLRHHGIGEVAINVCHLPEAIVDSLGDGGDLGMSISYSWEESRLGTAGGVKRMADFFDGTFVVHYGDVLTDFDLGAMLRRHRDSGAVATLAIVHMAEPRRAGVVEMDRAGRITSFAEKPARRSESSNLENGGTYVLEKEVLEFVATGVESDFGRDVLPELVKSGRPVHGYVLEASDYLIDVGSRDKYRQVEADVGAGLVRLYGG